MKTVRFWASMGLIWWCLAGYACGAVAVYDVRDYGAKGDGKRLCTKSIQKAIEKCARAGGGMVYFPPGKFLSGTIYMRSGVTLRLEAGSVLAGSTDLKDYPATVPRYRSYTDNYTDKSLIYGENLQRISITGRGIIDGQGRSFRGSYKVRPFLMRFIRCQNVVVEDVTIRNSPMWVQHYLACDDVRIDGITVTSRVNHNNDGIDIDSCHRVIISNCNVDSGDDAIVLKSTSARPCRDVVVSNCVLRSHCNALKMGTESNGGFENIVVSGCTIYDTRLAGVALEMVDGGIMERVVVSDITMDGVGAPIFLRLGNRARPFQEGMERPGIGALRNVTISNIEASGAGPTGCAISGLPEAQIKNVTLNHIRLSFAGGGRKEDAGRDIAERPAAYPEYSMFGRLPGYGFYGRHINGLRLRDVQLQTQAPDLRPAVVFEDVADAVIDGLDAEYTKAASSMIRMTDVRDVVVRGCRPGAGTEVFLRLEGSRSSGIMLGGNDFRGVAKVVDMAADVPPAALVKPPERVD